jgi:hypothetical protein
MGNDDDTSSGTSTANTWAATRGQILIELKKLSEDVDKLEDDTPMARIIVSRKQLREHKKSFQTIQDKILTKVKATDIEKSQGDKIREFKDYITIIDCKLTHLELLNDPLPNAEPATQPAPTVHEFMSSSKWSLGNFRFYSRTHPIFRWKIQLMDAF